MSYLMRIFNEDFILLRKRTKDLENFADISLEVAGQSLYKAFIIVHVFLNLIEFSRHKLYHLILFSKQFFPELSQMTRVLVSMMDSDSDNKSTTTAAKI